MSKMYLYGIDYTETRGPPAKCSALLTSAGGYELGFDWVIALAADIMIGCHKICL